MSELVNAPTRAGGLCRVPVGRTGVSVTELGFGAGSIGGLYAPVSEEDARAAVDTAWDVGIRYFDTAPHYGLGVSERRLGQALAGRPRAEYVVSSKVGRLLVPSAVSGDDLTNLFAVPATHRRVWDFSADGVRRSLDDSLDRLGLDRVDVVLIHDPDEHGHEALTQAYPALEGLRAEGVVSAIGVGMNQADMLARFVADTDIDLVLCANRYTLLEQPALDRLLPEAVSRGVSVVVGGVFNSGLLADPQPGARYDYAAAAPSALRRARMLQAVTEQYDIPLRAAALRFPFGHPAVASVLVAGRSAAEMRDAAIQHERVIPAEMWMRLRAVGLIPPGVPVPEEGGRIGSPLPAAPSDLDEG